MMATYIIGTIVIAYGLYMLISKAKTGGCQDCSGCASKSSGCSIKTKGDR